MNTSRRVALKALLLFCLSYSLAFAAVASQPVAKGEEVLASKAPPGIFGGRLVTSLRAEPKTLNPVTLVDGPSRDVVGRMAADLIHINRATQLSEPALAKSWKVSKDGLHYTLELRRNLKFSDGHPFNADDVLFSFQVYLDEKVHSPQRDLLVIGDEPIAVHSKTVNQSKAQNAIGNAVWIESDLNKGRLNTFTAVQSWRNTLGLK